MVSRTVCLLTLFGVVLVACADRPNALDVVKTSETTTITVEATATTTTTIMEATTTTAEAIDPELVAVVEHAVDEWNSGDPTRWRATFSEDAVRSIGVDFPIDSAIDEYEFFAVLELHLTLGNCKAVDSGIQCSATSTDVWADKLGKSPLDSVHTFTIEDGLIVRHASNFIGADNVRTQWGEFAVWVDETHEVDIQGFPGTAEKATLALDYMDDWIEETNG